MVIAPGTKVKYSVDDSRVIRKIRKKCEEKDIYTLWSRDKLDWNTSKSVSLLHLIIRRSISGNSTTN